MRGVPELEDKRFLVGSVGESLDAPTAVIDGVEPIEDSLDVFPGKLLGSSEALGLTLVDLERILEDQLSEVDRWARRDDRRVIVEEAPRFEDGEAAAVIDVRMRENTASICLGCRPQKSGNFSPDLGSIRSRRGTSEY